MQLNTQRIIYAISVSLCGTLATLAQSGALPPMAVVWVVFAAGTIHGVLQVLNPAGPVAPKDSAP